MDDLKSDMFLYKNYEEDACSDGIRGGYRTERAPSCYVRLEYVQGTFTIGVMEARQKAQPSMFSHRFIMLFLKECLWIAHCEHK